jgi:uncharacterized membrane protein YkoI
MPRPVPRLRLPALLIAGLAVVCAGVASAAAPRGGSAAFAAQTGQFRHAAMTLDQAIEMAEKRFHARVVRAGVEESNGQRIYVLRLVSEQGRVWTVRVDSQSGSVF